MAHSDTPLNTKKGTKETCHIKRRHLQWPPLSWKVSSFLKWIIQHVLRFKEIFATCCRLVCQVLYALRPNWNTQRGHCNLRELEQNTVVKSIRMPPKWIESDFNFFSPMYQPLLRKVLDISSPNLKNQGGHCTRGKKKSRKFDPSGTVSLPWP